MYEISKDFSFCYGHRVWNQKLEKDYCESRDDSCKCKHLHGHEALVKIKLFAQYVGRTGFVTDFKHMGWVKNFFDDNLDHKFIIDKNDPLFVTLTGSIDTPLKEVNCEIGDKRVAPIGWVIDLERFNTVPELTQEMIEYFDSFFIVNFVPTSENLAKWTFDIVEHIMSDIAKVQSVEWNETPKSKAVFIRE